MTITTLPTRTIGSLGPTKADLTAPVDYTYHCPAVEEELIRECARYVCAAVGIESGYATTSLQGRMDIQENPERFELREPFCGSAIDPRWTGSVPGIALLATARGGVAIPLDSGAGIALSFNGNYCFNITQAARLQVSVTLTGNPAANGARIWFRSAAGEGWGILYDPTGTHIYGCRRIGGADNNVEVGHYVADTEHLIDMYLSGNKMYVKLDGGTAVDCGSVATLTDDSEPYFNCLDGGAAGEDMVLRNLRITADWS